jgi:hypothetical protein
MSKSVFQSVIPRVFQILEEKGISWEVKEIFILLRFDTFLCIEQLKFNVRDISIFTKSVAIGGSKDNFARVAILLLQSVRTVAWLESMDLTVALTTIKQLVISIESLLNRKDCVVESLV